MHWSAICKFAIARPLHQQPKISDLIEGVDDLPLCIVLLHMLCHCRSCHASGLPLARWPRGGVDFVVVLGGVLLAVKESKGS